MGAMKELYTALELDQVTPPAAMLDTLAGLDTLAEIDYFTRGALALLQVSPSESHAALYVAARARLDSFTVAAMSRAESLRNAALWKLAGDPAPLAARVPDIGGDTLENRAAVAAVTGRDVAGFIGRLGDVSGAARLRAALHRWAVQTHDVDNGAVWVIGTHERVTLTRP